MGLNGFCGGIYRLCEWVTRLFALNFLWVIFTLGGLGVLGVFPATSAMFTIVRKWLDGEADVPIFLTFWSSFWNRFWPSQLLGYSFLVIGLVLFFNMDFFGGKESLFSQAMLVVSMNLVVLFLIVTLYLFPVFTHFDLKPYRYILQSLFIGFLHPIHTFVMAVGFIGLILLLGYFPKLAFFFGASSVSCYLTWSAHRSFQQVYEKREGKLVSNT